MVGCGRKRKSKSEILVGVMAYVAITPTFVQDACAMGIKLFLSSLEIHNFRTFEYLRIDKLGKVNLLVGKNNVGKSSLLEALWLYAYRGHPTIIWNILEQRDEGRGPKNSPRPSFTPSEEIGSEDYVESIKQLFHRNVIDSQVPPATIGPIGTADKTLKIMMSDYVNRRTHELETKIVTDFGVEKNTYLVNTANQRIQEGEIDRCVMVPPHGLSASTIVKLWDDVALTNLEDDVLSAMRIIAKDVERINLLTSRRYGSGRIPIAKMTGASKPIPLRSLGEGMNRMFGIALALVSAKDGILLIDEIETGLHYSIQPDVWRLVFEVARRLNIQVFATTHSWDCLTAFQEAAKEDEQDEGVLVRLVEKNGKITANLFDEDELNIVAREGIEIR